MKVYVGKLISTVALTATILPSLLYFAGAVDHDAVKWAALPGTIVWFVATPLWMGQRLPVDAAEIEI